MTELYLYQTVHLARGRARNAEAHAARLDAASRELFGRPYAPAAERLAKRIETLSAAERYPAGVSGFVRIELDPDGTERLLPAGVSLYDGYALRSLQPEAVTLRYDLPLTEAPTSAREAAAQLAFDTGSEIFFDEQAQTPWFSYTGMDGAVHEVWFEDVRSSLAKFELVRQYGLGGLGYWNFMRPFAANFSLLNAQFRLEGQTD